MPSRTRRPGSLAMRLPRPLPGGRRPVRRRPRHRLVVRLGRHRLLRHIRHIRTLQRLTVLHRLT
ncbi:hypothetical protein ACFQ9Z_35705 [Streptomyces sp. NPDC056580]|uniref:hypothetical protein n=1 Tax=Streptomyces sp. NPDC056580 TaxID=3345872 RepID=UPI00368C28EA